MNRVSDDVWGEIILDADETVATAFNLSNTRKTTCVRISKWWDPPKTAGCPVVSLRTTRKRALSKKQTQLASPARLSGRFSGTSRIWRRFFWSFHTWVALRIPLLRTLKRAKQCLNIFEAASPVTKSEFTWTSGELTVGAE